jgi:hypothetical protein
MSADNASYPPNLFTSRTSMYNITLQSSYQPHNASILKVYYPLPGSWFAAGFLPNWDMPVQQEVQVSIIYFALSLSIYFLYTKVLNSFQGLGHKCQYSLGSIAIWTQVANIEAIPLETTTRLRSIDHYSYYRCPFSQLLFNLNFLYV